ncbi:MAG: nucleoside deaminase [Holosporales bacterium]|jgi:tRNA(Arg) A34 adenosine deaminase TadA|nr:nucleoside deaminase [Holosporales bacterium]
MKAPSPMQRAIQIAKKAFSCQEVPVGAILLHRGNFLAEAHNAVINTPDPTGHAEILVMREGARLLGTPFLTECTLYVTLEPCPMCAQAMAWARLQRLCFGAYDQKRGGVEHGPRIFAQSSCPHRPEICGGIEEAACGALLTRFFVAKRSSPDSLSIS